MACTIPGTDEEFTLKKYKEGLGKSYSRITLFLAPVPEIEDIDVPDDSLISLRGATHWMYENTNSSHVNNKAQTDDVNAQNLEENTETGETQSLLARPKRHTKPSLKSIQNRMQTEQIKESKLREKVQCNISMLETTSNSPQEIRAAMAEVHASFHDYQLSVVSYIDFLVHANSPQCVEENMKN